ncbi:hypothetical protein Q8W71_27345 [Methylobacterium sp. NEAU 140]|uniref:hypothetical protein n=1 Tax=Methylobacterium sp. NEAU 140 TaxID=3064945 RepID=UPI00273435B3|nr:hypothetical protein [Methylobacterium sp. NEAU 140]MDP4026344.1 hypothetical protein [Methylobacterium sp. NEAU 140]
MSGLRTVPTAELPEVWPRVLPWIAEACRRGDRDQTPADLLLLCRREEAALVLIYGEGAEPAAAGVAQVRDHADGDRVCAILAVGGSGARGWRETLRTIEENAARIGCSRIAFAGRPGWAALLPDYDRQVMFTKRLEPALAAVA